MADEFHRDLFYLSRYIQELDELILPFKKELPQECERKKMNVKGMDCH